MASDFLPSPTETRGGIPAALPVGMGCSVAQEINTDEKDGALVLKVGWNVTDTARISTDMTTLFDRQLLHSSAGAGNANTSHASEHAVSLYLTKSF